MIPYQQCRYIILQLNSIHVNTAEAQGWCPRVKSLLVYVHPMKYRHVSTTNPICTIYIELNQLSSATELSVMLSQAQYKGHKAGVISIAAAGTG